MPERHQRDLANHWLYDFDKYQMELGLPPAACRFNQMSRVVGVDGRFRGAARLFPGFTRIDTTASFASQQGLRYFEVQEGTTNNIIRGFVVLDGTTVKLQYFRSAAWTTKTIGTIDDQDAFDIAFHGRFLYITRGSSNLPFSVRWDTATADFISETMGGEEKDGDMAVPVIASRKTGRDHFLDSSATYRLAYRFYDSVRQVYTGLSSILTVQPDTSLGANSAHFIQLNIAEAATKFSTFDFIELWRTIANGALLFLEGRINISGNAGDVAFEIGKDPNSTAGLSNNQKVGLVDDPLTMQQTYDFENDAVGLPPKGKRIGVFQNVTVMQSEGASAETVFPLGGRKKAITIKDADLRWSPLFEFQPENFPPQNTAPIPAREGGIQDFVEAGDFMWGIGRKALYRIHRSGTRLAVNRIYVGWGALDKLAAAEMGNSFIVATRRGVIKVDDSGQSMAILGMLDRLMLEPSRWGSALASLPQTAVAPKIQVGFDEALGALFILNTERKECLIIWESTGLTTLLEDVPWDFLTSGPDPTTGGTNRVWFQQINTQFTYRPDPELATSGGPHMVGGTAATLLSGAATGGSTTTLVNTGAVWTTDLIGFQVYIWPKDGTARLRAEITGTTGTQLTFADVGKTIVSGDTYSIAPVAFRLTAWPMHGRDENDWFSRRKVASVALQPSVISGDPSTLKGGAGGVWRQQVFQGNSLAEKQGKDVTWDAITDAADELLVYFGDSGHYLSPGWECYEVGVYYEVLSGRIRGEVLTTDKVGS